VSLKKLENQTACSKDMPAEEHMKYPVAEIFFTIQGEGHLRGFQQTFIRLAGCSVGCPECDTDYSRKETLTAEEIAERAVAVTPKMIDPWAWITGGEPADYNLAPLLTALKARRFSTAVARVDRSESFHLLIGCRYHPIEPISCNGTEMKSKSCQG
jgi:organic radical activating enzyme